MERAKLHGASRERSVRVHTVCGAVGPGISRNYVAGAGRVGGKGTGSSGFRQHHPQVLETHRPPQPKSIARDDLRLTQPS